VPPRLADWLLARALAKLVQSGQYGFAADVIRKVSVSGGRLVVSYAWKADLPDRLRSVMVPPEEQARLRVYQESLGEKSRSLSGGSASLAELLRPLFARARERSERGDPIPENRAAMLVLALYVNGAILDAIVPAAKCWPRPASHRVTLNGRDDLAKHFAVSAALAANAGGPLSDAVGLYKEVDDSRHGSGFSFIDLAADRTGTRFGEVAAESAASAAKLQRKLSGGVREGDVMPSTEGLPEFLPEAEFLRRFGGIGAPAYRQMMAEIERRIGKVPAYR
jgi:hypothetical protein